MDGIADYFNRFGGPLTKALGEHLTLSFSALLLAIVISIPLGILASRNETLASIIVNFVGIGRVIPSIAVLLLLYPVLKLGFAPALVALTILAIPPITINTNAGLRQVSPATLEAAKGVGMTWFGRLWQVELPLALPVIIGGVRTASIEVIASATLATFIGAGGFGDIINQGITSRDTERLLTGAIPVTLLAILVEVLLGTLQRYLTPKTPDLGVQAA